ncbi:MAG: TlpA family protein disulfide reductase [Actinomycetia bacterium]|nr:TlpA family protein disulfide reductase [Actinomycetes bacterium]
MKGDRASWIAVFVGAAVVLGVVGIAVFDAVREAGAGDVSSDGWTLPALVGDGEVALDDFRGTPVVLNFFASWCTACEAELPEFRETAEALRGEVRFVFINSQDSGDLGLGMAQEHGIDSEVMVRDFGSNNSAMFRALGGRGMPITAFYDADGQLVRVSSGALLGGALTQNLTDLGFI